MAVITVDRKRRLRADKFAQGEEVYDDDLAIRYGCCGDWESLFDPADFANLAAFHRTYCGSTDPPV